MFGLENEKAIITKNLSKILGSKVVNKNISIEINKGEVLCITGDIGSGKTTFLKQLVGMESIIEGTILVNNENIVRNKRLLDKYVAYQPQNTMKIFKESKVKEAIYYTGLLKKLDKEETKIKGYELIKKFKIEHLINESLNKLSSGERQILNICMTFMGDNPILIFDEPLNNVDIERKEIFMNEVIRRKERYGHTIIISANDLSYYESIMDSMIVLYDGEVILKGSSYDICNELNNYVKLIIKNSNLVSNELLTKFCRNYRMEQVGNDIYVIIKRIDIGSILESYEKSYRTYFDIQISSMTITDKLLYFYAKIKTEAAVNN